MGTLPYGQPVRARLELADDPSVLAAAPVVVPGEHCSRIVRPLQRQHDVGEPALSHGTSAHATIQSTRTG
ncbi:MAG: hypothetical protein M3377_01800 [Actinomycetota bacterium]|nr:hypothetical protein [Actinomycetota bacterium]